MKKTFFVAGDRCEIPFRTKSGELILMQGRVTKFVFPHEQCPNGYIETVSDRGATFCGDSLRVKKIR